MNDTRQEPGQDSERPSGQSPEQPPVQPPAVPEPPRYAPPQFAPPRYVAPPQATPQPVVPQPPLPPQGAPQQFGGPQSPYAPPFTQQQSYAPQPPQYGPPSYGQPAYSQQQSYPYPGQPMPFAQQPYTMPATPGPGEPFDGASDANDLTRPLYGANIGQAISRFFKNYVGFSGRASRSEYWWWTLAFAGTLFTLSLVGAIIDSAGIRAPYGSYEAYEMATSLVGLVYLIIVLGTLLPYLALTWRRLHDANMPGPFFFFGLIPGFGWLILIVFAALPSRVEGRRFARNL